MGQARRWLCALAAAVIILAGCGGTPTVVPATPTQAAAVPTATAMSAQASVVPTVTPLPPATTSVPTSTVAAIVPAATATMTPAPTATLTGTPSLPTTTATRLPLAATTAPTATATRTVPVSRASLAVNGQGVSYSYPNGWQLIQETKDRYSQVSMEGPDGALLSLTMYGMDMEPQQLAAMLLDMLKKQFSGATTTAITGAVGGFPAEGYTLRFTYMGVPMTGTILAFRGGQLSFTLYTQAADEDLSALQPEFDLIKNSLVVK